MIGAGLSLPDRSKTVERSFFSFYPHVIREASWFKEQHNQMSERRSLDGRRLKKNKASITSTATGWVYALEHTCLPVCVAVILENKGNSALSSAWWTVLLS